MKGEEKGFEEPRAALAQVSPQRHPEVSPQRHPETPTQPSATILWRGFQPILHVQNL